MVSFMMDVYMSTGSATSFTPGQSLMTGGREATFSTELSEAIRGCSKVANREENKPT